MSRGRSARPRQRAASAISAVESGPPETARTSAGKCSRPPNSRFISAADEIGVASSAADAFLLTLDALSDRDRCARILAQHFRERRAGGFALAQLGKRLAEPQQRIRSARAGLVLG